MTDVQLDVLVASISPISDQAVADLSLDRFEHELLEAILTLPRPEPAPLASREQGDHRPSVPGDDARIVVLPPSDWTPARHRHRPRRVLAALAVAAALLVAGVVWQQQTGSDRPSDVVSRPPDGPTTEPADEPAPSSVDPLRAEWPKVVVDLPGWVMREVTVSGEPPDEVTVIFEDGPRRVLVMWAPRSGLVPGFDDARGQDLGPVQVLGHETVLRKGAEGDPYGDNYIATWYPDDDHVMWASGFEFATSGEFVEALSALRPVDPDTFYAARPADHIGPEEQPAVIDELMSGVPTPLDFEASRLVEPNGGMGVPRELLVRPVVDAVVCGWARTWDAATDAGNTAEAQEAAAAMTAVAGWSVIDELEMSRGILEEYRQSIAVAAGEMTAGRVPSQTQERWEDALHCEA